MPTMEVPPARHLIDGAWAPARRQGTLDVVDPFTHETFHAIADGDGDDVDAAVAAARRAAPGWAALSPSERGALLGRWAALIGEHVEELAAVEARDVGKPLSGGRMNIWIAQGIVTYFAGAADKLTGVTLPTRDPGYLGYTVPEPYGVCAVVIPWNVPAVLTAANVAPALAAGNTVVLKPSEVAPMVALALAGLALRAGLPPGVLNVVTGLGPRTGVALTAHPDVDHISFVGSTGTGRAVMTAAAAHLVPVKLELGGKSPNVLFADADLDVALPAIVASITENAGQNCYAGSRLVVESTIHDEVVERLAVLMAQVRSGPWDADLDMGPLVTQAQHDRVAGFLKDAEGARLVTGGSVGEGWFVEPTVFDRVTPGLRLAREEIFGPVLAVQEFTGYAQAVELMNGTDFGLLACLWTNDVSRALRLARDVRAGQVAVNQFHDAGVIGFPFNMQKDSGFSRGGGYAAMREYTQEKAVAVRLLEP
ncbi:aldehyde dehydrogenase family protein [Kineosporia sp. J2-2]|uniref:Aldehyde dehydrogenase family protein n=1 Tax=Kineosporia corallincola TaxID=2835133 RepID=A0ABS5TQN1_9ACTN|nr:aldehyde dehydrogenase family protein [Kineosporia corallincola]MBT0772453.1 aldehyde dehydrogenase family protein [Kineosporia corallincola]